MEGKKRKKKISRGKKGKKSVMYFNEGTTEALRQYQNSEEEAEKTKLYLAEIKPAFETLAQNLISIYGFRSQYDSREDLKNDCVAFLYEAIHKFDFSRGKLPFSYFNVVAKNWLIIRSKQRSMNTKRNISIHSEWLSNHDMMTIESFYIVPSQDEQLEEFEFIKRIYNMLDQIRARVTNENELNCINAIIEIFKSVDTVEHLNKRAVFTYIREHSGLSSKQLTTTIAVLKKHYRELRRSSDFGVY